MDAKITLSFDAVVIDKAKEFADKHNISLSRLTEFLLSRAIEKKYINLDEMPVADWIHTLQEGKVQYKTRKKSNRELRAEYHRRPSK